MNRTFRYSYWMRKNLISRYPALLVGLTLLLSGCASMRGGKTITQDGESTETLVQIPGSEDPSKKVMANIAKPYKSPLGDIALDVTSLTEQWLKYFQGKGRRYMEVYLERSSRYLPMMKNTLREYELPEDLVYIALIESGFSPVAHSHANAVGYWQFIRGTGKRYGLKMDPFIDERRDPVLSTRAAAEYFKTLYNMFGNWHLAMASYNVGENRVKRAVMKYYTRDYWELVKHRRSLPKETKHYVPKFIAAALIAKDPEKYGFTNINYQAPLDFDTVQLTNPVSMPKLAQAMNVEVEKLRLLNPKFRGDYVPQYRGAETMIRVPLGMKEIATASIAGAISEQPKVIASEFFFYRIRSGDSLSTIARRHRTSVATLKRLNGLGNRTLLRVGQKLRVQDRGGSAVSYEMPSQKSGVAAASEPVEPATEGSQVNTQIKETHVVRRGENLTTIARKYGLTVAELRRLNNLNNRAVLRAGQTLRLKENEPDSSANRSDAAMKAKRLKGLNEKLVATRKLAKKSKVAIAKALPKKLVIKSQKHRVQKGETLAAIAARYRVTIGSIAKRNSMRNSSRLLAGAELVIPADAR